MSSDRRQSVDGLSSLDAISYRVNVERRALMTLVYADVNQKYVMKRCAHCSVFLGKRAFIVDTEVMASRPAPLALSLLAIVIVSISVVKM